MTELKNHRPVWVEINAAALKNNIQQVKSLVPNSKVMAVIKADGYGHGMNVVAEQLNDADEFAVNSLDDVINLRNAGFDKPVTVLSAVFDEKSLMTLNNLNTRITIFEEDQLSVLEKIDEAAKLSVWLKVDTGMGRLGVLPDQFHGILQRLKNIKAISDISLMTHLANADDVNNLANHQQFDLFEELIKSGSFTEVSILNSAGVVNFSEHSKDTVRPGMILYGVSPTKSASTDQLGLMPVMTFKSRLISVKAMPAGSSIGYGATYVLDQDARIGVVACGYGDGYPRHAKNGTPILVNDFLVPLIGRVSMDMICVDLSCVSAQVGDEVILWGEGNPVEEVAEHASTIAYELCCGILPRVARIIV